MGTDRRSAGVAPTGLEPHVRGLAATTLAFGAALMVAPGLVLRVWLGRDRRAAVPLVLARSVGGRDVALGLGTLFALRRRASVRGWLQALMVAVSADALALVAARRRFPRSRIAAAGVPTVAALLLARWLVSRLET